MSYQVYLFNSQIPPWLNFMMANYDILPRPDGVGSKLQERIVKRFRFGIENEAYKEWADKNITAFYYSSFYLD